MLIAFTTELGNDEVYYRLYADPLQWNYFDHPPMVGWLIRVSTFNFLIDTGFTIRLGAVLCSAFATWLMFLCGKRLLTLHCFYLWKYYCRHFYTARFASNALLDWRPAAADQNHGIKKNNP
jgi:Dolichyl-phosphate-mannose-protein mannosyltransferase